MSGTTGGLQVSGVGNGFQLAIPASTTPRVLNLYVGRASANAQLDVSLSDGSAAPYTSGTITSGESRFSITFAANSSGQTLNVNSSSVAGGGTVTLMAASLASAAALPLSVAQPLLSPTNVVAAGSTFNLLANPQGVEVNGTTGFSYQWQVDNGGGYDNIPNGTNNPLTATAGSAGSYNYRVAVTNSTLGATVTSAPVALTVTTPTGTLSALGADLPELSPTPLDIDLTAEGVIDWAHWGYTSPTDFDHQGAIIGNYTQIGSDPVNQVGASVSFTWTDGTTANPSAAQTTSGISVPVGNGFELNIPAETTNRLVHIYVGASGAYLHLEASMSDNTAPIFTEDPAITSGTRRYSILYRAASPGQTLKVRVTEPQRATSATGYIALLSASLQSVPALSVTTPVASPGTTVVAGQLMNVSIAPLQPEGAPPFYYQWRRNTGSGLTNIPNATSTAVSFTVGSAGSESCDVVIANSQGSITSAPVVLTVTAPTGVLQYLGREAIGTQNLTAEGGLDWSHWGASATSAAFDQKAGVPSLIGDYVSIGTGSINTFGNTPGVFTWTDGTPTPTSRNTSGLYHSGIGNGFELDVAAAQTNRLLHVYVGSWNSNLHLEAALSDDSAPPFVDETLPRGTSARYNILFAAGAPGRTLSFKIWDINGAGGNVTLMAASLEAIPTLAVAQPVIAPTNIVAAGSTVTIQAQAQGLIPLHYQWQVDNGSGFVAIPNSDTNKLFAAVGVPGGMNYQVVVTDRTGSVTSAPVALTVTAATSTLVASSTNADGLLVDLTAEGILDWAHWGYGGPDGFDQKDFVSNPMPGVTNQISNYTLIGEGTVLGYGGGVGYDWTDGTPPNVAVNTGTGIYIPAAGNGFEVDVPATATERVFNIYCGLYFATMHFEATMSDNSAPIFVDESFTGTSSTVRRYSIRYSSPSPGQYLKVRYWDAVGANVTLVAASLTYGSVNLHVQPVGGGQLQVTWPVGTLLEAPTINGPWTANSTASPYTFTPTGSQKYFRAIVQ
jgi:hypothetical protein